MYLLNYSHIYIYPLCIYTLRKYPLIKNISYSLLLKKEHPSWDSNPEPPD